MILLVSKNKPLATDFVSDLKQEGFLVDIIEGYQDVRTTLYRYPEYRMVIVDLESLEAEGLEVFQQLKEDPRLKYIPVICIIRKNLVVEQLMAFELGADDFIYVPYTTLELQLKIRTIQGLLDLQAQLKENEGKIKVLNNTQKILVTISHYINNSLTPLYNLAQSIDIEKKAQNRKLRESTTQTVEFIKKVITALNNYVQTGEFRLVKEGTYKDLMLDIEKELHDLESGNPD